LCNVTGRDKDLNKPGSISDSRGANMTDMTDLSRERRRALAEKNGWPFARADGFLDGESFRRLGTTPPMHAQVGFDEYCLGFRAGYYERNAGDLPRSGKPDTPAERVRRNAGQSR
jgi:hypothetical protein